MSTQSDGDPLNVRLLEQTLTCIRCQGLRRKRHALCGYCRWSPIRVFRVWWHTR